MLCYLSFQVWRAQLKLLRHDIDVVPSFTAPGGVLERMT